MKKKVVPKLRQEVKVDMVTSDLILILHQTTKFSPILDDINIYYTGKFQDFTARYIINLNCFPVLCKFSPFPNKPWFLRVCSTYLLKTLWERAISPFPTAFSNCSENFLPFSSNLELSSAKLFPFGRV